MRALRWAWPALSLVLILGFTVLAGLAIGDTGLNRTITEGLIMAVAVVGIYIFIGNSGILSFGHTAFMAVGAYASAWATCCPALKKFTMNGLPPFLLDNTYDVFTAALGAGLLAALFAAITGLILMRLNGVAATIATLALLFIVHVTYSNWESLTRGKGSLVGLPTYVEPWVALSWAAAAIAIAWIYQRSRFGLVLRASRENEVAARACGTNVYLQRLIAFVLSAFVTGIAGVLHAHYLGTIQIDNYFLNITLMTLAMLVVGGRNSLAGAVAGVAVVTIVVEVFRQLENGVAVGGLEVALPNGVQQLALAGVMLLILTLRPAGLLGRWEVPWPARGRGTPAAPAAG
ncbi:branched-chain amino acid ABC transporter permease [Marinibaculum pumilum]|uniref:Branched-chain amino acid ABC transporter permease n=1 Tax=Marinibaculum pumilum TaxID=1766165 RepID=A0ABV7L1X2_9PROT